MIPRYPDMDSVDSISSQLAQTMAELHGRIAVLESELDAARQERDDARRMVECRDASISHYQDTLRQTKDRLAAALEAGPK